MKVRQLKLLKNAPSAYGGELLKTRKGRSGPRPLVTRQSMHLVLRSSHAKGAMSFLKPANKRKIEAIVTRFSNKYGVRILSLGNVGNHLHFHIHLTNRHTYKAFIRAVTSAIAMAVTGINRWTRGQITLKKFWDYRPYTLAVTGWRHFLNLRDYIRINQLEGFGISRQSATFLIKNWAANTS